MATNLEQAGYIIHIYLHPLWLKGGDPFLLIKVITCSTLKDLVETCRKSTETNKQKNYFDDA
jgi:hypothetical protein